MQKSIEKITSDLDRHRRGSRFIPGTSTKPGTIKRLSRQHKHNRSHEVFEKLYKEKDTIHMKKTLQEQQSKLKQEKEELTL